MTTDKEMIYTTTICSNKIIKLTVFDNDKINKLIITKFEKSFLGLKDSIFVEIQKNSVLNNNCNSTSFVIRKSDGRYYDIFKKLLTELENNTLITLGKKDTKKYGKKSYIVSENDDYIKIEEQHYDKPSRLSAIELTERDKEYDAFNSLMWSLSTQYVIEKNQKVKKMVYKNNI